MAQNIEVNFCKIIYGKIQAGMRRSWVLADGERKRLTRGQKSPNNKTFENVPTTNCPLPTMETSLLLMDKEESDQIQDYLDKMTMIRNQTEDMNPEVRFCQRLFEKFLDSVFCSHNFEAIKTLTYY